MLCWCWSAAERSPDSRWSCWCSPPSSAAPPSISVAGSAGVFSHEETWFPDSENLCSGWEFYICLCVVIEVSRYRLDHNNRMGCYQMRRQVLTENTPCHRQTLHSPQQAQPQSFSLQIISSKMRVWPSRPLTLDWLSSILNSSLG